jgi:hypothetical protein
VAKQVLASYNLLFKKMKQFIQPLINSYLWLKMASLILMKKELENLRQENEEMKDKQLNGHSYNSRITRLMAELDSLIQQKWHEPILASEQVKLIEDLKQIKEKLSQNYYDSFRSETKRIKFSLSDNLIAKAKESDLPLTYEVCAVGASHTQNGCMVTKACRLYYNNVLLKEYTKYGNDMYRYICDYYAGKPHGWDAETYIKQNQNLLDAVKQITNDDMMKFFD